jgi:hypothetical protein
MSPREPTYTAEGGGWLVLRRPEPDARAAGAVELLARATGLPGNLRYVHDPDGVALVAEVRCPAGGEARERLDHLLAGVMAGPEPPGEALEAALEASGLAWSRRDTLWAVPATERIPRELQVRAVPGGARVEAVLAEWGEVGDAERQALADFLLAAQAGLRGARCELDGSSARVVALVEATHLDTELADGLMSVAVACRLLVRAVAALLAPDAARAFLGFRERQAHGLQSVGLESPGANSEPPRA